MVSLISASLHGYPPGYYYHSQTNKDHGQGLLQAVSVLAAMIVELKKQVEHPCFMGRSTTFSTLYVLFDHKRHRHKNHHFPNNHRPNECLTCHR